MIVFKKKFKIIRAAHGRAFAPAAGGLAAFLVATLLLGGLPAAAPETRSEDQRYIAHGDTVTDTRTGLMWQRQDAYLRTGHWMDWPQAFAYVEQLNQDGYGGYTDWRMPTLEELRSLYEENKENSRQVGREMVIHIDPIFGQEGGGSHWSSESNGKFNAFGIVFNTGRTFSAAKKSKSRKSVRAVRSSAVH